MGIHVIKSTTAPTVAPTELQVGAHWVKTTNPKGQWFAVGSDTLADWVDQSAIAGAVARTGDTMTGPLKVPQTLPTDADNVVATKKYVDDNAGGGGSAYGLVSQGGGVSLVGTSLGSDLGVKSVVAGPGIDIVADDYANTITFTPTGGGGSGESNTTSNVGTGEGQLAKAKDGVNLPFKTIKAGANVTITNDADEVVIAAAGGAITTISLPLPDPATLTPGAMAVLTGTFAADVTSVLLTVDYVKGVKSWTGTVISANDPVDADGLPSGVTWIKVNGSYVSGAYSAVTQYIKSGGVYPLLEVRH